MDNDLTPEQAKAFDNSSPAAQLAKIGTRVEQTEEKQKADGLEEKATPISADKAYIFDSEDENKLKKAPWPSGSGGDIFVVPWDTNADGSITVTRAGVMIDWWVENPVGSGGSIDSVNIQVGITDVVNFDFGVSGESITPGNIGRAAGNVLADSEAGWESTDGTIANRTLAVGDVISGGTGTTDGIIYMMFRAV